MTRKTAPEEKTKDFLTRTEMVRGDKRREACGLYETSWQESPVVRAAIEQPFSRRVHACCKQI